MIYGSVCSGIESATVAWHPLGWTPAFFAENSPFPSAVLAHHYPTIPNYGDITKFKDWPDANIDVLVGGTPCQSYSLAGLRKGLDDPRGDLMLTYVAIARKYRPRWVVWENVPGVLSSDGGRDFGSLLGLLSGRSVEVPKDGWKNSGILPGIESAYGIAWRCLDAQYFGLAQRRARVFVVGCLGDWRGASAVLLERESMRGDPAPSREAREDIAATLTRGAESSGKGGYARRRQEDDVNIVAGTLSARTGADGGLGTDFECDGGLVAKTITASLSRLSAAERDTLIAHTLTGNGFDASEDGTGRGIPLVPQTSFCLNAKAGSRMDAESETLIAFDARQDPCDYGDCAGSLSAMSPQSQAVMQAIGFQGAGTNLSVGEIAGTSRTNGSSASGSAQMVLAKSVRRLTPVECARLQGFPDNYLDIQYRGKPAKDGPKYQALGNSKAVPVVRWIGRRIQMVDEILKEKK